MIFFLKSNFGLYKKIFTILNYFKYIIYDTFYLSSQIYSYPKNLCHKKDSFKMEMSSIQLW